MSTLSAGLVLAAALGQPAPPPADPFGDPLPPGAVLRLGTTRLRHADLCALAFTAENKLVSFGRDYVVRTWDLATGRQLAERAFEREKVHRNWPGCLSADATRLAVQYDDGIKVFDVASGRELAVVKLTHRSLGDVAARFSPDGGRLAVMEQEGQVHLLDLAAKADRSLGKVAGPPSDVAFSRDGKRLAVAALNSGVTVWDLAAGRELGRFKPTGDSSLTVDFDATGDVLAVLGFTNPPQPFQLVRVSTGQAPDGWTAPPVGDTAWARFAPDGATLVLGRKDGVRWFDPKAGKEVRSAVGLAIVRPAFSADGKLLASGGGHTVRVWDAGSGKSVVPANITAAPDDEVGGVSVSPDGKWILTKGGGDGTIRVWEADGKPKGAIRSNRWGDQRSVFSPDGKCLYAGPPGATALARFDLPGGRESARYTFAEPPGDDLYIVAFGLSADGRRLAAILRSNRGFGGPGPEPPPVGRVTVWDTATGRRLETRVVQGIPAFARAALSPDLRWYTWERRAVSLTGGPDYALELPGQWHADRAAVSPDGRFVAQAVSEPAKKEIDGRTWHWPDFKGVVVHETATGKRVLTVPVTECGAMAFTPDGRGLVVTDADGIARWDLETRKAVVRRKAPGPAMGYFRFAFTHTLALSPDGTKAVTGQPDTTALVWELAPPARTARKLSDRELAAAWDDLAGGDAPKAYAAVWALADAPADAVPFLRGRLKPVVAPKEDEVGKLVARLDAAAFAQREAAAAAIRALGDAAAPALRAVLKGGLSAEQAGRVERLLAEAEAPVLPPGDRLRRVRAVAALEWAGTADARTLLAGLAAGAAGDRQTREAAAAVRRLSGR